MSLALQANAALQKRSLSSLERVCARLGFDKTTRCIPGSLKDTSI